MARAGQVIGGPHTKIVFVETSEDTSGKRLTFTQTVQPGAPATPEHLHTEQTETFRVLAGLMGVRVGGAEKVLGAGEVMTVPAGVSHAMWNAGQEVLTQEIRLEPALNAETFFETVVGLEGDGELPQGNPSFTQVLQFALLAPTYRNPLGTMPLGLQRILFALLTPLAYLLGYRSWYPKYSPYGPVTFSQERQNAQKEPHHVK